VVRFSAGLFVPDSFHAISRVHLLLQEVNRVLKPGGVLEVCHPSLQYATTQTVTCQVIDEDLLFPGRNPPPPEAMRPAQHCHPPSGPVPPLSVGTDSHFLRAPDTRSINAQNNPPLSPHSSVYSHTRDDWDRSEADLSSLQFAVDPVDHSKLNRAWHEMLTSRWISPSITSVLPFYLSAIFQDFRALPALDILIGPSSTLYPSSSGAAQQMIDPEPFRHLTHATVKDDAESSTKWMLAREAPPHLIPAHASMHLARMVAIVMSCKDAIWDAYNKLYGDDPRQPRLNDEPGKTSVHIIREEFEGLWLNWEW